MINDKARAVGTLMIELRDASGNLKDSREINNLVVNTGKALFASRLKENTTPVIAAIAVGTDTTATDVTQTALLNEIARSPLDNVLIITTSAADDSVQYTANFPAGVGTGALTEAGTFNDLTAGIMVTRVVYPVINKGADDALSITWKIQFQ